ncbi:tRNA uridine(34) 5-carboxymethylaminomethyl modification radical SAM/GNAT enzyme Elp3 [Patescibacteria group bacterium]|nr:tRNA uridine(34) 5-carboxymethylaminomethyl modification radical SAM/GNAT enzyme Elp3 [Patescibacteria group bacterium]MBU4580572.1 tRNA uridine(34) 5-carboxymethylaminomethyl modification radical SAM/GNAT enzyme Elp3 [Patescibacteria group bacterium]
MINTIDKQIIKQIIKQKTSTPDAISALKRKFGKKHLKTPTNIILLKEYNSMIKSGALKLSPKRQEEIKNLLRVRKVRSQSGVAVVAVLTKNFGCPGHCLYCPTEKGMPKSYLSNEPAVMRAIASDFDPYRQVQTRIEGLEASGHPTDKVELIIIGGTFGSIPDKYRYEFIKRCFQAANNFNINTKYEIRNTKQVRNHKSETLKQVKRINEKAKHRIVGITIETRPDYISEKEILKLRELGVTRVELGVQNIYDDVLKINKRGHNISQTIEATRLLKDAGFKINYHMMPNLPGSSIYRDKKMFRELFSNENFQPDILKIYPTVVVKNSELYQWWKRGKYKPCSDKQLLDLLIDIKKSIPPYVRIMRLIRDIPAQSIVAGSKISNLRQIIEQKTRENLVRCRCIRCREIGKVKSEKLKVKSLELIRRNYNASGGKEIFLSLENVKNDKLYALLRLRIPSEFFTHKKHFIGALQNAAIIREAHTYGQLVPIAQKGKKNAQHIGLGKQLIAEAERISREEFGAKKITVISGVGVRDYYRKLGYRLKNEYMVKNL